MSFSTVGSSRPKAISVSTVKLTSRKSIKWVELQLLSNTGSIVHEGEQKTQSNVATFQVPEDLSLIGGSMLRLKYSSSLMSKKSINITVDELLGAWVKSKEEKQVWTGKFGKQELEVEFIRHSTGEGSILLSPVLPLYTPAEASGELRPTTDVVLEICPRFRILVMGKSGAGKSSLINKTFGVTDAHVASLTPGGADIDQEILSKQNPHFLLHDSRGFEHGEDNTVDTVQKFIKRRNAQVDIKEKLHAIWLCIEIPTAGGRLLEAGVENFLELKKAGELGDVPIIVVLTKYDKLVSAERLAMARQDLGSDLDQAKTRANARLEAECASLFKALVSSTVPHVIVSTSLDYENTLDTLVDLTYKNVENYIGEAAIVTGISQRINPSVKIQTSIQVGKRKYWKGLASSTNFTGITLQACLEVIHLDIVKVWDLHDPNNFLGSDQFKGIMLSMTDSSEARDPARVLGAVSPVLGAVGGMISALTGPVAPIVIPIIATVAIVVWVREVYQKSRTHLRRLMTYILDLTLVMQNLFWIRNILATRPPQRRSSGSSLTSMPRDRVSIPITRRLIKLAVRLHLESNELDNLHTQIHAFSKEVNLLNPGGADTAMEKIIELIDSSTINTEDAFRQLGAIQKLHESWLGQADDTWDALSVADGPMMKTSSIN